MLQRLQSSKRSLVQNHLLSVGQTRQIHQLQLGVVLERVASNNQLRQRRQV